MAAAGSGGGGGGASARTARAIRRVLLATCRWRSSVIALSGDGACFLDRLRIGLLKGEVPYAASFPQFEFIAWLWRVAIQALRAEGRAPGRSDREASIAFRLTGPGWRLCVLEVEVVQRDVRGACQNAADANWRWRSGRSGEMGGNTPSTKGLEQGRDGRARRAADTACVASTPQHQAEAHGRGRGAWSSQRRKRHMGGNIRRRCSRALSLPTIAPGHSYEAVLMFPVACSKNTELMVAGAPRAQAPRHERGLKWQTIEGSLSWL